MVVVLEATCWTIASKRSPQHLHQCPHPASQAPSVTFTRRQQITIRTKVNMWWQLLLQQWRWHHQQLLTRAQQYVAIITPIAVLEEEEQVKWNSISIIIVKVVALEPVRKIAVYVRIWNVKRVWTQLRWMRYSLESAKKQSLQLRQIFYNQVHITYVIRTFSISISILLVVAAAADTFWMLSQPTTTHCTIYIECRKLLLWEIYVYTYTQKNIQGLFCFKTYNKSVGDFIFPFGLSYNFIFLC